MNKVWQFLKDSKLVWLVVGALAIFGGGFSVGRYFTPPQTVVTEKVKEVIVEKVVEKVVTDVKVVKVTDSETIKKLHREIWELKHADGTTEKKVTEDLNVNDVVHTNTQEVKVVTVDKVVEKWQDRVVEKVVEKNILKQPDWRVAAGVGISVPKFLNGIEVGTPGMKGAVVDIELDRRVIGPFWMGIHGNTQGTVGLNLSAVF